MDILNSTIKFFAAASEAEEKTGIGVLALDIRQILIQAGTFLLLYLLVRKFALGKIVHFLEERKQTIDESLENAAKIERDLEKTAQKQEQILRKAREESDGIIAKAHEEAGALVQEAENKASAKAEEIIKNANLQIEAEISKAKSELKKDMLALVANATEVVLSEKIDQKKDAKLIETSISQQQATATDKLKTGQAKSNKQNAGSDE